MTKPWHEAPGEGAGKGCDLHGGKKRVAGRHRQKTDPYFYFFSGGERNRRGGQRARQETIIP